jgi:hypothetical protein
VPTEKEYPDLQNNYSIIEQFIAGVGGSILCHQKVNGNNITRFGQMTRALFVASVSLSRFRGVPYLKDISESFLNAIS